MTRYLYEYGAPNQMGSWFSSIVDSVTGHDNGGQTATKNAHATIEGSFSLIISQQLASICMTASPADIKASVASILTAYNAYDTVGTSADVASAVIGAVVGDLQAKSKLTPAPGCIPQSATGTTTTTSTGQMVATNPLGSISPLLLGAGGLALFAVLMMGRK